MKTIDAPQGSAEWFAARAWRVTASRVKDVMAKGRDGGASLTRTAYMGELIAETLTGQPANPFKGNEDTARGNELEPAARLAFEIETGETVTEVGGFIHPRMNRVAASPDGILSGKRGLEIKCPKPHIHLEYLLAGVPPPAYVPQMALQAACAELDAVWFASYCPLFPQDLQLFTVLYVPTFEYLRDMENAIEAFLDEMDAKLTKIANLRYRAA